MKLAIESEALQRRYRIGEPGRQIRLTEARGAYNGRLLAERDGRVLVEGDGRRTGWTGGSRPALPHRRVPQPAAGPPMEPTCLAAALNGPAMLRRELSSLMAMVVLLVVLLVALGYRFERWWANRTNPNED